MKKLLLGILATVIVGNVAFAQGQLIIANTSSAGSKIFTNGVNGGQAPTQVGALMPGNATALYTFALFVNSTTNAVGTVPSALAPSLTPWTGAGGWSFASFGGNGGDYALNGALPGRIAGVDNAGAFASIAGFGVGINANVELIGWNNAVGGSTLATFMAAYTARTAGLYYGYSGVGNITLGDNGANIVNSFLFGSLANGQIGGFSMAPPIAVPEPGTMALVALGSASLLLFRRKK
jgi:hypothetical protein